MIECVRRSLKLETAQGWIALGLNVGWFLFLFASASLSVLLQGLYPCLILLSLAALILLLCKRFHPKTEPESIEYKPLLILLVWFAGFYVYLEWRYLLLEPTRTPHLIANHFDALLLVPLFVPLFQRGLLRSLRLWTFGLLTATTGVFISVLFRTLLGVMQMKAGSQMPDLQDLWFPNRILMGSFVVVLASWVLVLLSTDPGLKAPKAGSKRLKLWLGAGASALSLLMLGSLNALISLCLIFLFWLLFFEGWTAVRRDARAFCLGIGVLAVVLLGGGMLAVSMLPDFRHILLERLQSLFKVLWFLTHPTTTTALGNEGFTSFGARLLMWKESSRQFLEAPLFGHGYGTYQPLALVHHFHLEDTLFLSEVGRHAHPHNQYLFLLSGGGLVGLVGYLGVFALSFWVLRRGESQCFRRMGYMLLMLYLLFSVTETLFVRSPFANYFLITLSGLLALSRKRAEDE